MKKRDRDQEGEGNSEREGEETCPFSFDLKIPHEESIEVSSVSLTKSLILSLLSLTCFNNRMADDMGSERSGQQLKFLFLMSEDIYDEF